MCNCTSENREYGFRACAKRRILRCAIAHRGMTSVEVSRHCDVEKWSPGVPKSPSPSSRQLALAAEPQPFFRFQLRHRQQMVEQAELVAPGELGQFGSALGDEGRRLVGAALSVRFRDQFLVPGFPIPAGSCTFPAVPNPAQKTCTRMTSPNP